MLLFHALKLMKEIEGGVFADDFSGHSTDVVKNCVKSTKIGGDDDDDEDRYELIDFHIMGSGITPKSQTIDLFLGKIFKAHYRDLCDMRMIDATVHLVTGNTFIPSRQLCSTWVVSS